MCPDPRAGAVRGAVAAAARGGARQRGGGGAAQLPGVPRPGAGLPLPGGHHHTHQPGVEALLHVTVTHLSCQRNIPKVSSLFDKGRSFSLFTVPSRACTQDVLKH